MLYFDWRYILKFWVYIDDVFDNDGVMCIVLNLMCDNCVMRESCVFGVYLISDVENQFLEFELEFVLFCGLVGMVFIYDIDVLYGVSLVVVGYVRCIMWGYSWSDSEI